MVRLLKRKKDNYVNISQRLISDDRLSWKARGIFAYLWGQADNWQFYVDEIVKHATDGKQALQTGLLELEKYGYLERYDKHSEKGVFDGKEWILSDIPHRQSGFTVDGEISQKDAKKSENTVDGETRRTGNRSLTNINNNYYQEVTNKDIDSPVSQKNNSVFKQIIDYLNDKTKRNFKYTNKSTQRLINARVNDGYDVADFKRVIDTKCAQWLNDKKMYRYLRPDTLFGPKFEGYLNENVPGMPMEQEMDPRMLAKVPDEADDDLPF